MKGFSGSLPVAVRTAPHGAAPALLTRRNRPVRQQQLVGVAGLLRTGCTRPALRPRPAHQPPLPPYQTHRLQRLQRPQHAARVAPGIMCQGGVRGVALPVHAQAPQ